MKIVFSVNAWEDYVSWVKEDRKIALQISGLIKEILRTPFSGKGKPEPLKYDLSGLWSRRITREHRLVYTVRDNTLIIYSCRFHYDR